MSRPRRLEFPGAVYYIHSRGLSGRRLFRDDADRKIFLDALAEICNRFRWTLHSYVLMDDHYQLALTISSENLSRGMRQLNGVYTQYSNRRHGTAGPLFHGRFRSVLMERETYLLDVCRHMLLEPERQRVARADKYRWSSCRALIDEIRTPAWLDAKWLSEFLPDDRESSMLQFRRYLASDRGNRSPMDDVSHQVLLGGADFIEQMLPLLNGTRLARRQLPRRTSLRSLFLHVDAKPRSDRNDLIRQAHFVHLYTLQEIGDHLGLHYTTVSKVINSGGKGRRGSR